MCYRLAGFALAPILIAQAWHVRRVTPRLAEPSGARTGAAGSGPPLRLLIAGDSSAAGVGVASQRDALSGQLGPALEALFALYWGLEARTGFTVKNLLDHLKSIRPEPFDVALLCVGVNDVTAHTAERNWLARHAALIELLSDRFGVGHVIFSGLPPMHVFPALPQPLRWYLGARAARLDAALDELVRRDARCEMLRVAFPLQAAFMAADGFHPGAAAYRLWGEAAAAAIRRRVAGVAVSGVGGANVGG